MTPSPKQFTSEDLKRLKEQNGTMTDMEFSESFTPAKLEALLARLEAAEECAEYLDAMEHGDIKGSQALGIIKAWRQRSGVIETSDEELADWYRTMRVELDITIDARTCRIEKVKLVGQKNVRNFKP